jgi:primosomal protein N''
LSLVVGRSIQVIEHQDFERRVAALEEAREKRDEEKNS